MPIVTYCGMQYSCATAIKGDTYIRLLDQNDILTANFQNISDFSRFSISDGDWTSPENIDDCCIVVMRRDGTLAKTAKRACDVGGIRTAKFTTFNLDVTNFGYDGNRSNAVIIIPLPDIDKLSGFTFGNTDINLTRPDGTTFEFSILDIFHISSVDASESLVVNAHDYINGSYATIPMHPFIFTYGFGNYIDSAAGLYYVMNGNLVLTNNAYEDAQGIFKQHVKDKITSGKTYKLLYW